MKVVSVNAEKTVSFKQIAFNVDEELTPEFVSKIRYGNLKITGSGTVLFVQIPADSDATFNADSVNTLNKKLQAIEDEFAEAEEKRQRLLQAIAHSTNLPLA